MFHSQNAAFHITPMNPAYESYDNIGRQHNDLDGQCDDLSRQYNDSSGQCDDISGRQGEDRMSVTFLGRGIHTSNQGDGAVFAGNLPFMQHAALKSTQDKLERQQETQNQISYWEQQKENLKNIECTTLEEIAKKLERFHSYEDGIAAARMQYNSEQMWHVMDESREMGDKIAEEAEKMKPKTAEERRREMVEEALGTDENKGELTKSLEEVQENVEEQLEKQMEEQSLETAEQTMAEAGEAAEQTAAETGGAAEQLTAETFRPDRLRTSALTEQEILKEQTAAYKGIDILI